MKILISIRPKWCKLIADGKKTIEVRKTKPRCPLPFKAFIYESKSTDKSRLNPLLLFIFVFIAIFRKTQQSIGNARSKYINCIVNSAL